VALLLDLLVLEKLKPQKTLVELLDCLSLFLIALIK
jgi:hypothetical protein